ncbi:hypothetical protein SELMODRAFT_431721 [Selaginella moellendorffii]|uniref:Uncharacterized protein n=1 Tax=Selaginella moellendorffii TaxID=88036 RepID=D8TDK4_SELML|nr:hypothetical protein SELMODRAFT_431721 [Selaginella moellendorffii]
MARSVTSIASILAAPAIHIHLARRLGFRGSSGGCFSADRARSRKCWSLSRDEEVKALREDLLLLRLYGALSVEKLVLFYWHPDKKFSAARRGDLSCNFIRYLLDLCHTVYCCIDVKDGNGKLGPKKNRTQKLQISIVSLSEKDLAVVRGFELRMTSGVSSPLSSGGFHRCALLVPEKYTPATKYQGDEWTTTPDGDEDGSVEGLCRPAYGLPEATLSLGRRDIFEGAWSSRGFMLFVGSRVVFDGENTYTRRKSGTRESGLVLYGEWLSGTNDNGSQCIFKLTSSGCDKSPVFSKGTFTCTVDKHFWIFWRSSKSHIKFDTVVSGFLTWLGFHGSVLFTVALAGNDLLFPFVTRNATLCEKMWHEILTGEENTEFVAGNAVTSWAGVIYEHRRLKFLRDVFEDVDEVFLRKVRIGGRIQVKRTSERARVVESSRARTRKEDLEAQAQKFEHLIFPRFAEQREFFDMDSSQFMLLKSGQVLVFIRDVLTSRLDIHLIGYFGARSTGPPKTFNRGADLLAFDEFGESFRELTSNGVTIQLGGYRGSRDITWMEFVPGKEELLVTDVTRCVRVFEVVQPAMMKARVIQLPPSFLGPCLTSDGLCLLAVCGSPSEDGVALSAEVHRLDDSLEHMKTVDLGLAVRDGNNFQLATYPAAGG